MFLGLLTQLVYLRNHNANITEVSGFVIRNREDNVGVIRLTVSWIRNKCKFVPSYKVVPVECLEEEVLNVVEGQKGFALPLLDLFSALPLSMDDLKHYGIPNPEYIVDTKYSVVVVSQCNHVWKLPLWADSVLMLMGTVAYKFVPKQLLLPIAPPSPDCPFYKYKLLEGPASDFTKLRECFKQFAKSVFEAINELHLLGYAHLDIRLPSILFRKNEDGSYSAVLIDFDTITPLRNFNDTGDTNETCDWVQYAELLKSILPEDSLSWLTPGEPPNLGQEDLIGLSPLSPTIWN